MQDIHSVGSGGGGRLFGAGAGDRRLRQHHHHSPQALKCPRCDSLNTKFCYYNNYNLSQPRHFCKSCRRYWTKGGVLRNVPVGGGCRKTKRSKPKSSKNTSSDAGERKSSNSQNSSSESSSRSSRSSLTANTTPAKRTATVPVAAAEVLSGINSTNSASALLNFHETSTGLFNIPQSSITNPSYDPQLIDHSPAGNNMFPEIGTFTGLITSSTSQLPLGFNISGDISPFRLHHTVENSNSNQQQWMHTDHTLGDDLKVPETGPLGFTEFSCLPEKTTGVGIGEDWNNGTDQALFDLTGTVDQSYWSQTQWEDHDHGNNQDDQLNYLP